MHTSKVFLWVLVIVLMGSSVVQCQQRPRPGRGNNGRPSFRDSMLGSMLSSTLVGARDIIGNIGLGMLRTMGPGPRGAGRGGRRPPPQRQNGLQQQGRLTQDDDYYDDYDNFEDTSFNTYDYIASGEISEPVPAPPNLPFRNNNRIRNSNRFGDSSGRFNRHDSSGPKQFNRPQIINELIQRSDLNGPFYPHPVSIGKKK